MQLGPALQAAQSKALRLLTESTKLSEPTPQPPEIKPVPKQGKRVVGQGAKENLEIATATDCFPV